MFSLAITLQVKCSCHCMLKPKTLTEPEDNIQDIRFATICVDLRRTGMPNDNEILYELYDFFQGLMCNYLSFNPAGEVIHGYNKTELLIIPISNNSCIQRHQLERVNSLDRLYLLIIHG